MSVAGRIPIHPEAFSRDLRTRAKHPRQVARNHLGFIRGLPCAICATRRTIDAAHIRARNPVYAKRRAAMGEKPDDRWTVPLCRQHHDEQHAGEELGFWSRYGIDPFALALSLWGCSGDDEAGEIVIRAIERTNPLSPPQPSQESDHG